MESPNDPMFTSCPVCGMKIRATRAEIENAIFNHMDYHDDSEVRSKDNGRYYEYSVRDRKTGTWEKWYPMIFRGYGN